MSDVVCFVFARYYCRKCNQGKCRRGTVPRLPKSKPSPDGSGFSRYKIRFAAKTASTLAHSIEYYTMKKMANLQRRRRMKRRKKHSMLLFSHRDKCSTNDFVHPKKSHESVSRDQLMHTSNQNLPSSVTRILFSIGI